MARKASWKYCYRVHTLKSIVPLMHTDSLERAIKTARSRRVPCQVLANVRGDVIIETTGEH